jgi:polyhydroxybutyrate depolymerase
MLKAMTRCHSGGAKGRGRALLALAAALSTLAACAAWELPVRSHAVVHNDTNRGYRIYVPESVKAKGGAAPLVLVLQGAGPGIDIMDLTRIADVAEREGFVAAFPRPVGDLWNDGTLKVLGPNGSRDVSFLRHVVADIDAKVARVDRRRIYAIGLSNGGMMSLRLACEAADLVAGVAAVAAAMPAALADDCRPSTPVSVLVVNGTDDPLIPYRGGAVRFLRVMNMGEVLPTDDSVALWARLNGCGTPTPAVTLPDRDSRDDSRAVQIDYTGCRGARVRLIRIEGGGHTWPGGLQFLPALLIGTVNHDINAGEAAWRFFQGAPPR